MNGPVSASTDEPVWERPWSLEEIRRSSQNWSLGADAGLLHFLREFSQQTISRTHEIEKELEGLVRDTKATDCRLHNVFNDFLMLSNTQFIENRVYDEEVEEHIVKADPGDKPDQEKTREQKEAELIPKIQQAVNYGLRVLETAFEQLDIKAGNSDSEEEEVNEKVELILEPKDLYIDRPLPYLIGSQLFMQQEDVGLGDLSSEEGSVDNDRGSAIDSEDEEGKDDEEESEEEFNNNSEEEKKLRSVLSDEDEDYGSDLFGDSDKENEDDDDKSTKKRTKSFADELAARIQAEVPKRQETDQSSVSSLDVKPRKEKREAKKLPSDDEEDDIFKPPKLTDEDFFGSKGGLFSGGRGLFDDDDEEADFFSEIQNHEDKPAAPAPAPKSEPLPAEVKKKPPYGGVSLFPGGEIVINSSVLADKDKRKALSPTDSAPKSPTNAGLFDDDDMFGGTVKPPPTGKAKAVSDLFADEDDLFNDHTSVPPATTDKPRAAEPSMQKAVEKNVPAPAEKSQLPEPTIKKQTRGLFSDEDDSESDLFLPSQNTTKSKASTLPTTKTSKAVSLFDDEDDDLFGSVPEKKPLGDTAATTKPVRQTPIPTAVKVQTSGLFSSDEEDPVVVANNIKAAEKRQRDAVPEKPKEEEKIEKKSSLFDEDDLFAITKDSQKKHQRISLLFEDDNSEEPLFSSSSTPSTPVTQTSEQPKTSVPVTIKPEVSTSNEVEKKPESVHSSEDKGQTEPQIKNTTKPVSFQEPVVEDLFSASPPTDKHSKNKSKNVLSLFDDEDEDNMEDQLPIAVSQKDSGKDSVEKSTHGKSTGVFQDEELLFSQELQKDNDPDVDLFASANKKSPEKPKSAKSRTGIGLFGDDEEDDLFSTPKPKKPPKVQEKKTVIKKENLGSFKESEKLPEVKEVTVSKPDQAEKPTDPSPIKTKSPSSRIGKLQANLHINPAAMLPGAIPKLSSSRHVVLEPDSSAATGARNMQDSDTPSRTVEAVSFETPAQVDTLHSANKMRAKVGSRRRPPTRLGRKLASQDSGDSEDMGATSPLSPTPDTISHAGLPASSWKSDRGENVSAMKLSFSENDVQSRTSEKVPINPLTPDVNDLFGSDLFTKSSQPNPVVPVQKEESTVPSMSKTVPEQKKKVSTLAFGGDGSDDDLFIGIKQKPKKALQPTSLIGDEPEDDLFGITKPQKKADTQPVPSKDVKPTASDIFEDDIFAAEAIKPVKKPKEKKPATEDNLFDDHMDIFADLVHKPKEKKSKKKVEPKSIFDDDMDDIFSTSTAKKTKPKAKSTQPTSEAKTDTKGSSAFDDPLNVFGK